MLKKNIRNTHKKHTVSSQNSESPNVTTSIGLKPILYGLDMRVKNLSSQLCEAGYGEQINIADECCEVL